jgi:hypothetical protein
MEYNNVFCYSESTEPVLSLLLEFYINGRDWHRSFWVTEDMIQLYPMEDLTESTEDDGLDWIRDTNPFNFKTYYDQGYTDVGIRVNSIDEAKKLHQLLVDLGYEFIIKPPSKDVYWEEVFKDNRSVIIWARSDKLLQHSHIFYQPTPNEIIIDNPF